jgi:hypothetical protein
MRDITEAFLAEKITAIPVGVPIVIFDEVPGNGSISLEQIHEAIAREQKAVPAFALADAYTLGHGSLTGHYRKAALRIIAPSDKPDVSFVEHRWVFAAVQLYYTGS